MEITLHGNHPAEVVFNEVLARFFKKHGKWVSMSQRSFAGVVATVALPLDL